MLAKQVLSQLSYTPTVGTTLILKHFRPFQNPFLPFPVPACADHPPVMWRWNFALLYCFLLDRPGMPA